MTAEELRRDAEWLRTDLAPFMARLGAGKVPRDLMDVADCLDHAASDRETLDRVRAFIVNWSRFEDLDASLKETLDALRLAIR